jgi:molybdate/tungstate transport system substrate-binding protein
LAANEITVANKTFDILASADYRIIPEQLIPEHASWYVIFASNSIIRQGKIVVEGSPEKLKSSLQGEHVVEVAFDRDAPNLESLLRSCSDLRGVTSPPS